MPVSIVVPQLGESIAEGTVSKWLKKTGDPVRRDEPVVEIMTDKITVEVPSPADGTIGAITVAEGTTVLVGVEIATILKPGEAAGAPGEAAVPAVAAQPAAAGAKSSAAPPPRPAVTATAVAPPPPRMPARTNGEAGSRPGFLSPIVRRLAREHGVDPAQVPGTGRGGRITREDMLGFIDDVKSGRVAVPAASAPVRRFAADGPSEELVPLAGVRKVIAERMTRSKFTAVHTTAFEEVDVSALVRVRDEWKERVQKKDGVRLTFTPFFAKAAVIALRDFPTMNATWRGDDAVAVHRTYNIGIAVGRDEGLVVPVVKGVEALDLIELARAVNDLSERAHANRLTPDDLQGGTFSITNAGLFGAIASTPIINYPEVSILGVHKIAPRPAVVGNAIEIRPMTTLAVTFDHRWIDGHIAVQFLSRLKDILEKPEGLWFAV